MATTNVDEVHQGVNLSQTLNQSSESDSSLGSSKQFNVNKSADVVSPGQVEIYEVERILGEKKLTTGKIVYLLKWVGYSRKEVTWEPEEHLENCEQLLKIFKRSQGIKRWRAIARKLSEFEAYEDIRFFHN